MPCDVFRMRGGFKCFKLLSFFLRISDFTLALLLSKVNPSLLFSIDTLIYSRLVRIWLYVYLDDGLWGDSFSCDPIMCREYSELPQGDDSLLWSTEPLILLWFYFIFQPKTYKKTNHQINRTIKMKNSSVFFIAICVFVSMCQGASLVRRSTTEVSASQKQQLGCAVKPMIMKVYEPGCGVVTVITKGCHGYCASSSLYTNNDLTVNCEYCRPEKSVKKKIELRCPMLATKKKSIEYHEAISCRCDGCPWILQKLELQDQEN